LVDHAWVGLAFGLFHDLAYQEAFGAVFPGFEVVNGLLAVVQNGVDDRQ
jgi:hypothetical protein